MAGCKLYLTKPLGVGILTTAQKKGLLKPEHAEIAPGWMARLNKIGELLGRLESVKAMTDVTGFGLLGHLSELCEGSQVTAVVEFDKVPILTLLDEYLYQGCIPGGTDRNWASYHHKVGPVTDRQKEVLADPQTSGGLLVAVEAAHTAAFEKILRDSGLPPECCVPFGRLESRSATASKFAEVRPGPVPWITVI